MTLIQYSEYIFLGGLFLCVWPIIYLLIFKKLSEDLMISSFILGAIIANIGFWVSLVKWIVWLVIISIKNRP
jgi:hypothetical protein